MKSILTIPVHPTRALDKLKSPGVPGFEFQPNRHSQGLAFPAGFAFSGQFRSRVLHCGEISSAPGGCVLSLRSQFAAWVVPVTLLLAGALLIFAGLWLVWHLNGSIRGGLSLAPAFLALFAAWGMVFHFFIRGFFEMQQLRNQLLSLFPGSHLQTTDTPTAPCSTPASQPKQPTTRQIPPNSIQP